MENLSFYIPAFFVFTTCLTVVLFYRATNNSQTSLIIILFWLIVQAPVSLSNFYTVTNTIPPRFLLLIAPPFLLIAILFQLQQAGNILMI